MRDAVDRQLRVRADAGREDRAIVHRKIGHLPVHAVGPHDAALVVARDAAVPSCPLCDKPGKKAVSAPAFQFKGAGWYVTDYAQSGADSKKQAKAESEKNNPAEKPAAKTEAGESKTTGEKTSEILQASVKVIVAAG